MQAEFRYALLEDLPAIVEIYNSSVPGRLATADLEPVSVESKLHWFNSHNQSNRPLWVLEANSEIIGWMSFNSFYGRPAYEGTVELSIYLAKEVQGKGLGKMCLQKAMDEAKARGIKNILGFIFGHNEASLKLFHTFNFTDWGRLLGVAIMDGIERDLVIVGRRV